MSGIELFELGAFGTEEFTDTPNRLPRLGTNYVDFAWDTWKLINA